MTPVDLPPGLAERLADSLPRDVAPVRPLPGAFTRTVVTSLILALVALAFGLGAGGKGWRSLTTEQRWGLAPGLAVLGLWLSWELAQRMVPASISRFGPMTIAAIAALAVTGWTLLLTPSGEGGKLFYLVCLGFTSAAVGAAAWLTRMWMRRGFITNESTRWVLAAASGVAGFASVQLFCPYVEAAHILTSHVLPGILAGAAAGLVTYGSLKPEA